MEIKTERTSLDQFAVLGLFGLDLTDLRNANQTISVASLTSSAPALFSIFYNKLFVVLRIIIVQFVLAMIVVQEFAHTDI